MSYTPIWRTKENFRTVRERYMNFKPTQRSFSRLVQLVKLGNSSLWHFFISYSPIP
jgi:hypothetical protein